ncbi:MAG: three-Cys-motif partner protein TcmP [Myxococcales bacterium]|nr:three-Cys-motif partner protein TcmP [Myxococcales bacterium]
MERKSEGAGKGHLFGGDWTNQKLDILAKYLSAYTVALKDKPSSATPFRKAFIDAFAGTGYRDLSGSSSEVDTGQSVFPDLVESEPQALLDGSARIALQTDPPFDRYIFIERSPSRCAHLEALKAEFPERADRIDIQQADANACIQELCGPTKSWKSRRAVLFLDPYGMQVDWKTIEAVASTKAIDLWLLFPLGIGLTRLLPRTGKVPQPWRRKLDQFLGTQDWYDKFYAVETVQTLFGEEEAQVAKEKLDTIGQYFVDRLKTIFVGVAERPGVLRNSSGRPLYLLCFAVGNERGKTVALRIANDLLKEIR